MNQALHDLRSALPGVRLVLAAMGLKMCRLAGSSYDGAFFNWMTPSSPPRHGSTSSGAPATSPAIP